MTINSYIIMTFWVCGALVLYAYAAYPALIWCLSRWFEPSSGASSADPDEWPEITLLIAAYNEEAVIEERIRNALAMDYPRDRVAFVIALDGCSDGTAGIVHGFTGRGIRLLDYAQRRGKAAVLNAAMAEVRSSLVLLSDANTELDPQAAPPVGALVPGPSGWSCRGAANPD